MIFKICETSLSIQMAAPIPPMLKYSIVRNFLNSPPILIKFVSKFMACKVLHSEAQFALRLRSSGGEVYTQIQASVLTLEQSLHPDIDQCSNCEGDIYTQIHASIPTVGRQTMPRYRPVFPTVDETVYTRYRPVFPLWRRHLYSDTCQYSHHRETDYA